jgi:hypothetical protein
MGCRPVALMTSLTLSRIEFVLHRTDHNHQVSVGVEAFRVDAKAGAAVADFDRIFDGSHVSFSGYADFHVASEGEVGVSPVGRASATRIGDLDPDVVDLDAVGSDNGEAADATFYGPEWSRRR